MELFSMINPANKSRTPDAVATYRAEPYVVAADVYSAPAHLGRGGWTWYTGSASWMYRVGVESLLGLTLVEGALLIDPCIPSHWTGYEAHLRTPAGELHIVVENPEAVSRGVRMIELDGTALSGRTIPLDGAGTHRVRVMLGTGPGGEGQPR
jgi:cyclic beta-1,2-glucan synthetase